ncbi:MAG: YdbL family protein [Verrucomicrobiales bacterium]|jgi:uncharacterized protein YdbL (DUF1318 family)|nr:YdbL family protein [Verrucomicrobiales bacterium]
MNTNSHEWFGLALTVSALSLSACAPTVNIGTPEPVKIEVAMRADIYTHDDKEKPRETAAGSDADLTAAQRRYNRRGEIQDLKNNRVVGEGNNGLLSIRELPKDEKYADYAKLTVSAENADRTAEFNAKSEELKKPLTVYVKDFAGKTYQSAYPGEWVQKESGEWVKR